MGDFLMYNKEVVPQSTLKGCEIMHIGLVVSTELGSVLYAMKNRKYRSYRTRGGRSVYEIQLSDRTNLYVAHCRIGEIDAAAATQFLIDTYPLDFVAHFGLATDLDPENKNEGKIFLVEDVVHFGLNISGCGLGDIGEYPEDSSPLISLDGRNISWPKSREITEPLRCICASSDEFIVDPKKKEWLRKKFKAEISDIDSAGVVVTCRNNSISSLILKIATNNSYYDGRNNSPEYLERCGDRCFKVLEFILSYLTAV